MAHIKAFNMKFELKFGMNDNFMAKHFPTTFRVMHSIGTSHYFLIQINNM